jgi:hypothetical protein
VAEGLMCSGKTQSQLARRGVDVGGHEILPIDGQLISPLAVIEVPYWRP